MKKDKRNKLGKKKQPKKNERVIKKHETLNIYLGKNISKNLFDAIVTKCLLNFWKGG